MGKLRRNCLRFSASTATWFAPIINRSDYFGDCGMALVKMANPPAGIWEFSLVCVLVYSSRIDFADIFTLRLIFSQTRHGGETGFDRIA